MLKYYTRACNFYYGSQAKNLIKKREALPLCGATNVAFNKVEIFTKNRKKITSNIYNLNEIKKLRLNLRKKIKKDLIKITSTRKNFLKSVNFLEPTIMGILNITPDSFSDGGKYTNISKANKHIMNMVKSGAKIIDIGGESTRPGSKIIPHKIEWKRIHKILKNFKKKFKTSLLSVDTRKSQIMINSINLGADIINDVSGFEFDKRSIDVFKKSKITKVIHHMKGNPQNMQKKPSYRNVLLEIYDFFEDKLKKTNKTNIILDPGIGFGKTLKHNLTLISKISLFHSLGFPILIGTSRKRFINQISGVNDSKERIGGSVASVLFLISQGVQILRVHDVNEINQSIKVYKKILFNR
tara:strand:+ start:26 stop:1087 length:1062 start_codon:yes stop_codon:yes gene_type:complete